jgi:GNAT superfamily N-acetyltransferase
VDPIGKDNNHKAWRCEILEGPNYAGQKERDYYAYREDIRPHPTLHKWGAEAHITFESNGIAQLTLIKVYPDFMKQGVGHLLLNYVERDAKNEKCHTIYGYFSRDPSLWEGTWGTFKEYVTYLQTFYTKNGSTWRMFTPEEMNARKSNMFVGRVEKLLTTMSSVDICRSETKS